MHQTTSVATLLKPLRAALSYAAAFSVFVNLMMLAPTLYMLQVFDRVLTSRSDSTLVMLSVGVAFAITALTVVDFARSRLLVAAGRQFDELIGRKSIAYVIRLASSVAPTASASVLRDIATLRTFLSGPNVIAMFDAPWMLIYAFIIFLFHPLLGAIAISVALVLIVLAITTERISRDTAEKIAISTRRSTTHIEHGVRNADILNAMGMTSAFSMRWEDLHSETLDLMQSSGARNGTLLALSKFTRQATQVAMMGVGAWLILDSHATPGIMMASTILFGRAMAPIEALVGQWNALIAAHNALLRLGQALPSIAFEPQRTPLPSPRGLLQVEQVSLAGTDANTLILHNINFSLPAGASLGILGPSGAGKSSLAKVMLGIWPVHKGKVRMDGAALNQWDPQTLGKHLGYLPQDVELFPGTVGENICRFSENAGDETIDAARRACAYDMIVKLSKGFETRLGEGGIRLSAGQAQRVGLARAVFGAPCLVVLDEPNANLDSEGENALMQTLAALKAQGCSVAMITHKPSLVAHLDLLMVMREGRIELFGPRDDILAQLAPMPQHHVAAARPSTQLRGDV